MNQTTNAKRPKLLILEFWGIGDLTFATAILHAALEKFDVTVAAKSSARKLLEPSFPGLRFIEFDPPWTAFRGKYRLWRWPWLKLLAFLATLRRERFDCAVSVRNDPRDHMVMWLGRVQERIGFPTRAGARFLTKIVQRSSGKQHKVEDWRQLGHVLGLPSMAQAAPALASRSYHSANVDRALEQVRKPLIVLHPGARIPVRRWPEQYFDDILKRLRAEFDFDLALVLEPDGYGKELVPQAQVVIPSLQLGELVDLLSRAKMLLCNDSGPGHIAAACGTPTCVIFGPTDPDWFRPWGEKCHIAIRDICEHRPCFDYCRFAEPFCLTKLTPEIVWPDIQTFVRGILQPGRTTKEFASK